MKNKTILFLAIGLFLIPQFALASWWKPSTWFKPVEIKIEQPTNPQPSTPTDLPNTPISVVASSSVDTLELQSKIDILTSQNDSLQSKVTALQKQLTTSQNSHAICQSNLTKASTQPSQPSVTPTPPATSQVNKSDTAILSSGESSIPEESKPSTVSTTNGKYSDLPVLTFNIKPSADNYYIQTVAINFTNSGQGNINTVHLYQGGIKIATGLAVNGTPTVFQIPNSQSVGLTRDRSNVFKVRVDVSGLDRAGYSQSIVASVSSATITNYVTNTTVNVSGEAQGNVVTVTNTGTVPTSQTSPSPSNEQKCKPKPGIGGCMVSGA